VDGETLQVNLNEANLHVDVRGEAEKQLKIIKVKMKKVRRKSAVKNMKYDATPIGPSLGRSKKKAQKIVYF
jgi:hypothetical protein